MGGGGSGRRGVGAERPVKSAGKKNYLTVGLKLIGQIYIEKGKRVMVLKKWRSGAKGPRNVLILRADGTRCIRPFRGLRKCRGCLTLGNEF